MCALSDSSRSQWTLKKLWPLWSPCALDRYGHLMAARKLPTQIQKIHQVLANIFGPSLLLSATDTYVPKPRNMDKPTARVHPGLAWSQTHSRFSRYCVLTRSRFAARQPKSPSWVSARHSDHEASKKTTVKFHQTRRARKGDRMTANVQVCRTH